MKLILILRLIIAWNICHAEERIFRGRVIDKNGDGIPYAIIFIQSTEKGYYTDSCGLFEFKYNTDSTEIFVFRRIGYRTRHIHVKELFSDFASVSLDENDKELPAVFVTAKGKKMNTGILGKRRSIKYKPHQYASKSGIYGSFGDEYGKFLKADTIKKGILKTVSVYITSAGTPDAKVRLHIYDFDPGTNAPLNDITDSNVILKATKGNQWLKVDLSDKHIPLNKGIFVTIEWLSGKYYYPKEWSSEIAYTTSTVLGMTSTSSKCDIVAYRKVYNNNWNVISYKSQRKAANMSVYVTYNYR